MSHSIRLSVNGKEHTAEVEARLSLADFLRDELDLTGTHVGCEQGECGACTVTVDGEAVRSCLMLTVQADGRSIETVESLSDENDLGGIPGAFREAISFQCGFCSPGFLMTTHALLRENPTPTDEEIREEISGNICRCTGYHSILEGVRLAVEKTS